MSSRQHPAEVGVVNKPGQDTRESYGFGCGCAVEHVKRGPIGIEQVETFRRLRVDHPLDFDDRRKAAISAAEHDALVIREFRASFPGPLIRKRPAVFLFFEAKQILKGGPGRDNMGAFLFLLTEKHSVDRFLKPELSQL
jgi:hypothetical protein